MNRAEILEKLRETMKESTQEEINWDQVTEESAIESLGFDSLSILDLIYDIQQSFEVDFAAQDMINISTVGELAGFLEKKLSGC